MPCSGNGADTRSLVEGVTCGGLPDANRSANSVCDSANPNRDIQVCSSLKLFKYETALYQFIRFIIRAVPKIF